MTPMTTFLYYVKDPEARLDYGLEWPQWLKQRDGTVDSIVSASWEVSGPDTSLVIDDEYLDIDVTGVWLTGGTAGSEYQVTCHIVTAAGREDDRTIRMTVQHR